MNDAEVYLSHGVRIIIEQGDDAVRVVLPQLEFLIDFTRHRRVIRQRPGFPAAGIHRIDVPPHAHRNLRV